MTGLHTALFAGDLASSRLVTVGAFVLVVVLATLKIIVGFELVHGGLGGGTEQQEPKTNCPSCGARTNADADACDYCGDPLD